MDNPTSGLDEDGDCGGERRRRESGREREREVEGGVNHVTKHGIEREVC